MKRSSVLKQAIVVLVVAVAGAFAAYRYIATSIGEGRKALFHVVTDALQEATGSFANVEHALHYNASEKEFSVKSADSALNCTVIKELELHDFVAHLAPRPLKLAVVYRASDFPAAGSSADFEQRALQAIESAGVKAIFLISSTELSLVE